MNRFRTALTALAAAALLTACGGSDDDKVNFQSVVSFGDSLSDAGTYKVGTIAQLGGGKFTVNGGDDGTWTERLAAALGTPAQCAARTGLLPNAPGITGAPVQDIAACSNYAEGSSRITSEGSGPNGVALQAAFGQQNLGFMADSINEQFNRHLAKVGGAFAGNELVTVNGGGNDLFMQLSALGAANGGGNAAVATATVAGWPQSVIDTVAGGGDAAVNAAASAAVTAMGQAGAELAGYIKTLAVAKGAAHVVVRNLGNVNLTPFGRTLDAGTQGLITNMSKAFDDQLAAGLNGTAGVIVFDEYALSAQADADPASFGYSNFTAVACGPNAFSVPPSAPGSSIVCNASNLVAGDTSKYAFADSVHPTPFGHQQVANIVLGMMQNAGWR
jgi:outer membrane lipase/esterase